MLFAWAQDEAEGAMITLHSIVKTIREANLAGSKSLSVVRDSCEKKAFSSYKVGEKTMTYIHFLCGNLQRDDQFPYNASGSGAFGWKSALTASSVYIDPSEESKEEVTGTKDGLKYVIYKFHEVKINDVPLSPTLTDNVLFHIMVRKDESKDFEDYLFQVEEKRTEKPSDNPSQERIMIAQRIMDNDTRTYECVILPDRLTDDKVDCAEFVYDVLLEQKYPNFPCGGCNEQLEWFKANGEWGTGWKDVKVGDIVYWDRDKNVGVSNDHTGIITEIDADGTAKWIHSSYNSGKKSINTAGQNTTDSNGNIYINQPEYKMNFLYWARPEKNK